MDSGDLIPTHILEPGQQASIDQNMAGANNRIDFLLQCLLAHIRAHPNCPGAWCVSEQFADAAMDLSSEQHVIIITIMARMLVDAGVSPRLP